MKKQTVWLLTMLSLMVVLSVYYVISPNNGDLAYIDQGETNESKEATGQVDDVDGKEDADVSDIENIAKDELFTTIRMELQDERSRKEDRLNDIVASSQTTTEEKNEALESIDILEQTATKEVILQDSIMASSEKYKDVLVRSEDDKIHVHVKVDKLSDEEVLSIMQMARDEFGKMPVDVNFQPSNN